MPLAIYGGFSVFFFHLKGTLGDYTYMDNVYVNARTTALGSCGHPSYF